MHQTSLKDIFSYLSDNAPVMQYLGNYEHQTRDMLHPYYVHVFDARFPEKCNLRKRIMAVYSLENLHACTVHNARLSQNNDRKKL